jgi:hypothetical protein
MVKSITATFAHKEVILPDLPRLIFLDTNIVQHLQTFGEFIYDHFLSSENEDKLHCLGKRVVEDVEALASFINLGKRNGWPIAVSKRTLHELAATPEPNKRYYLSQWGRELSDYFIGLFNNGIVTDEDFKSPSGRRKANLENELHFLPHSSDRILIIDAIELGCDFFLTMDYKSLWRFRGRITPLGLRVLRPVEMMKYIEPCVELMR